MILIRVKNASGLNNIHFILFTRMCVSTVYSVLSDFCKKNMHITRVGFEPMTQCKSRAEFHTD